MTPTDLQKIAAEARALSTRRAESTARITTAIIDTLRAEGRTFEIEYTWRHAQRTTRSGRRVPGRVDVAIIDPDTGEPVVFIEIDSANKAWSLHKLATAAQRGIRAIWLRHGGHPPSGTIPDGVTVIHVP